MDLIPDGTHRSIEEYLGKLDPDGVELARLNELLQGLTQHPGWAVLRQLLLIEYGRKQHRLTSPKVLEHAEYAHTAGESRGLVVALGLAEMVRSKHERLQAALDKAHAAEERRNGD